MKTLLTATLLILLASTAFGWQNQYKSNPNYQQDQYGHRTRNDNMYKDSDGDGVINKYDYNDQNSRVQTPSYGNRQNNSYAPQNNPYIQNQQQNRNNNKSRW